jgi:hypothetical protein
VHRLRRGIHDRTLDQAKVRVCGDCSVSNINRCATENWATIPTSLGTIPMRTPQLLLLVARLALVLKAHDIKNVKIQFSFGHGVSWSK